MVFELYRVVGMDPKGFHVDKCRSSQVIPSDPLPPARTRKPKQFSVCTTNRRHHVIDWIGG